MALVNDFINSSESVRERAFTYLRDKEFSMIQGARVMDIYYYTFRNFMMERTKPSLVTLSKVDQFLKKNGY